MSIAFDLDGTLAHYNGWKGVKHIGEPIMPMVNLLKKCHAAGEECYIFTSRVSGDREEANLARHHISAWLRNHGIPYTEITCEKLKSFEVIYDDRAIQVIRNKGRVV